MPEPGEVLIVHSIDTEGPLYESLEATFDRVENLSGLTGLPRDVQTLKALRDGNYDLLGNEDQVSRMLSPHLITYNDTWDKIDSMLDRVMSEPYRNKAPDSFNQGWVYNWHCLDHVGYDYNPRRRDIGYHNIFDHYKARLSQRATRDRIHFHFHPMSTYKDAHYCASSFINSPQLHQIICRRIIERCWFPSVFRAGFHTERPDSHWFLEQWIPFDLSNISLDSTHSYDSSDYTNGRGGDWRLAPSDWSVYQPSHDNYQLPGSCRRWIGRALTVLNRFEGLDQSEMDKAFSRASSGLHTLVGITSHDFRDLQPEVDHARSLIASSSSRFPNVKYRFCEATEAFLLATGQTNEHEPLELQVTFFHSSSGHAPYIEISTVKGETFGPQPYLAIQTKSRRFIHDNLDFCTSRQRWYYTFDTHTLPLDDVQFVGVASNDRYGNTCIKRLQANHSSTSPSLVPLHT